MHALGQKTWVILAIMVSPSIVGKLLASSFYNLGQPEFMVISSIGTLIGWWFYIVWLYLIDDLFGKITHEIWLTLFVVSPLGTALSIYNAYNLDSINQTFYAMLGFVILFMGLTIYGVYRLEENLLKLEGNSGADFWTKFWNCLLFILFPIGIWNIQKRIKKVTFANTH